MKSKPYTLVNTQKNSIIRILNQLLGNIIRTTNIQDSYVDDYDPWYRILDWYAFEI